MVSTQGELRQILGSLRSVPMPPQGSAIPSTAWPFVTISRLAGAGGHALGTLLAERLNGIEYVGPRLRSAPHEQEELAHPWQCLDRELVERIAKDHHLSESLIESLETSSHTWISDLLNGLSHSDDQPSDIAVFRRVVETVHGLARAGHVILIGLGAVFMTHQLPAGIHIRIVAPLDYRVRVMAKVRGTTEAKARGIVETLDQQREAFFKRYWPSQALMPELFHLTLNSGFMTEEQMVDCVLPLLKPLIHHLGP